MYQHLQMKKDVSCEFENFRKFSYLVPFKPYFFLGMDYSFHPLRQRFIQDLKRHTFQQLSQEWSVQLYHPSFR